MVSTSPLFRRVVVAIRRPSNRQTVLMFLCLAAAVLAVCRAVYVRSNAYLHAVADPAVLVGLQETQAALDAVDRTNALWFLISFTLLVVLILWVVLDVIRHLAAGFPKKRKIRPRGFEVIQ